MDNTAEILDLLPLACYELNPLYEVTYVNSYALEFFGHSREMCVGRDIRDLFPEAKVTSCLSAIDVALHKGQPVSHDYVSAVTHRWTR